MGIFNSEAVLFRLSRVKKQTYIICTALVFAALWVNSAAAIGMAAAKVKSYIGEPLLVHIPIFNVQEPNELSVILQRTDGTVDVATLNTKVVHLNSQLSIEISSEQPTTEPYISFSLEVVDGNNVSTKNFTILLDLKTAGRGAPQAALASASTRVAPIRAEPIKVASIQPSLSSGGAAGSTMGPYDWAKAGQVPEYFGPVLDGQSLWRVARRINTALGVSVDQMMWSLYENNRDQFSSSAITSLKAGAILRIPSREQATRLTERQAKEKVQFGNNSGSDSSANSRSVVPQSVASQRASTGSSVDSPVKVGEVVDVVSDQKKKVVKKTKKVNQAFDLTSLEGSDFTGSSAQQSQQIIASLAEAIGNLTQESIKKDKKISYLEEKVEALEAYAQVRSEDLVSKPSQSNSLLADNDEVAVDQNIVNKFENTNSSNEIVASEPKEAQKPEQSSVIESIKSWVMNLALWHVLLIALLLLGVAGFLFREKIIGLYESLNLGGKGNEVEFDPSMFEQTVSVQVEAPVMQSVDPDLTVENNKQNTGLSQSAILDAIKSAVQSTDPLSPQTLIDLDGDFSYTEMLSEASVNESDLTLVERFNNAIVKRDFDYARQMLNFARESELDQPNYSYNRLRLHEAMRDEDGFYDFYCEVEQELPSYSVDLQTKISQLVLEMAHV